MADRNDGTPLDSAPAAANTGAGTNVNSLFAFVDQEDPFTPGELAGEQLLGPILSIMNSKPFLHLFLFHTPQTRENAAATAQEVSRRYPECQTVVHELPVSDPKDYSSETGHLARMVRALMNQRSPEITDYYVCVSSGTAEMRAAWFLLVALGVLPARMLQVGSPARPLFGAANVKEVRMDSIGWRTVCDLAMPVGHYSADENAMEHLPRQKNRLGSLHSHSSTETQSTENFETPASKVTGKLRFTPEQLDVLMRATMHLQRGEPAGAPEEAVDKAAEEVQDEMACDASEEVPDGGAEDAPAAGKGKETAFDEIMKYAKRVTHDSSALRMHLVGPFPIPGLDDALLELGIFVGSAAVRHAAEQAAIAAGSHLPVLLLGETGTGKERFAHLIHRLSSRCHSKLVPVNCAAIPASLAESYLLGHVKGAFSGAISDGKGVFEAADQGTLFLDEIGELTLEVQAKLLRVVHDGVVQRLGSAAPRKVDVRIIAASNRDLRKEVSAGRFREDLYFRLEVVQIKLPALRERRGEIPELALMLLRQINQRMEKPHQLTTAALARLERHSWPGNVRDLLNVLERSVLYSRSGVIDAEDLIITCDPPGRDPFAALPEPSVGFKVEEYLGQVRTQLFLRALEASNGNQTAAAELLSVSKQAVSKFLLGQNDKEN